MVDVYDISLVSTQERVIHQCWAVCHGTQYGWNTACNLPGLRRVTHTQLQSDQREERRHKLVSWLSNPKVDEELKPGLFPNTALFWQGSRGNERKLRRPLWKHSCLGRAHWFFRLFAHNPCLEPAKCMNYKTPRVVLSREMRCSIQHLLISVDAYSGNWPGIKCPLQAFHKAFSPRWEWIQLIKSVCRSFFPPQQWKQKLGPRGPKDINSPTRSPVNTSVNNHCGPFKHLYLVPQNHSPILL